jgi:transposase
MQRLPQAAFAAFVGIDWADAQHDVCFQAVGSATYECRQLDHKPAASDAWPWALQERCAGRPVAVGLALNQGPLVSALRKYAFLVRFPVNPGTLAKYRAAFTPSHAKDDPTDAALQLERWLTHRDKLQPLVPQSAALRALEQLVEHRRRLVGDKVRLTHRLTRTLQNYFPHVLEWFDDTDPTLFCDLLAQWPTLTAAPLARRATLERFFHAPQVRYANGIAKRLHAIKSATPLTTDEGVMAPQALVVQALVAQLRALLHAIADFDHAMAHRAQAPPDCPWFAAGPGAGAVFAPRRLVAFGEPRARYASADARQQSAGIAPVTERRGKKSWVLWRWQCPTCLRQTVVEGAAESIRHSCWARADSQQQRDKGAAHPAAVRALAFTWIRVLCRGWQNRTPYNESTYLSALKRRGSPLLHKLADVS